jgi:peptide/nickel transport system permease protein
VKKLIRYLLALFIIFSLNFFIPRAMPGDPVTNLLGEDFVIDEASLAELKAELGLDRSLPVQYLLYWRDVFRLDLGHSYHYHDRVSRVIGARMPWTLLLVGVSILLGAGLGTFLGALAGWGRGSLRSRSSTLFFLMVYSTPPFFLCLILLYVFAFKLGWFPLRGVYSTGTAGDILRHFLLPTLALTLYLASRYYLIMRGSVIQEKGKHYVLYARAKGLFGRGVLYRHVFKNASLPIVTLLALDFGFIFSGALFVEIVFSMNGLGTLIYDALLARDYPVLQGIFLVITVMVVAANGLADVIYPLIDPRVRRQA